MKKYIYKLAIAFLCLFTQAQAGSVRSAEALKDLSTFVFFSGFYADKPAAADEIHTVIQKELEKLGKVTPCSILVKTPEGNAIDVTGFDNGVVLHYILEDLYSPEGKKLGVVKASLNLTTQVEILQTKVEDTAYIWTSSCYLKGSTDKHSAKLVKTSIAQLLQEFSSNYQSVNADKPTFNYYN